MAPQIAHGAVAEIPPAVPFRTGKVDAMKRPLGRGSEPQVPIQSGRNRLCFGRPVLHKHDVAGLFGIRCAAVPSPGATDPDVNFAHGADRSRLNQLNHAAVVVAGMDLRAHLRGDLGPSSGLSNDARFPDVVSQRLFAIHVLAELQCRKRGKGVRVFTGTDNDGVELVGMVVELAKVGQSACPGMCFGSPTEVIGVDIAQRNDVLRRHRLQVARASSTGANHGDVELLVQIPAPQNGSAANVRQPLPAISSPLAVQEAATIHGRRVFGLVHSTAWHRRPSVVDSVATVEPHDNRVSTILPSGSRPATKALSGSTRHSSEFSKTIAFVQKTILVAANVFSSRFPL